MSQAICRLYAAATGPLHLRPLIDPQAASRLIVVRPSCSELGSSGKVDKWLVCVFLDAQSASDFKSNPLAI